MSVGDELEVLAEGSPRGCRLERRGNNRPLWNRATKLVERPREEKLRVGWAGWDVGEEQARVGRPVVCFAGRVEQRDGVRC